MFPYNSSSVSNEPSLSNCSMSIDLASSPRSLLVDIAGVQCGGVFFTEAKKLKQSLKMYNYMFARIQHDLHALVFCIQSSPI